MRPSERTGWPLGCIHAFVTLLFITGRTTLGDIFNQQITDSQFMTRSGSPYQIREQIVIERTGTLTIESGVVLNFHPGSGILVRGALIAKVISTLSALFGITRAAEQMVSFSGTVALHFYQSDVTLIKRFAFSKSLSVENFQCAG